VFPGIGGIESERDVTIMDATSERNFGPEQLRTHSS
jgi:hypothetical protein